MSNLEDALAFLGEAHDTTAELIGSLVGVETTLNSVRDMMLYALISVTIAEGNALGRIELIRGCLDDAASNARALMAWLQVTMQEIKSVLDDDGTT